jgi:hypothetical protein
MYHVIAEYKMMSNTNMNSTFSSDRSLDKPLPDS